MTIKITHIPKSYFLEAIKKSHTFNGNMAAYNIGYNSFILDITLYACGDSINKREILAKHLNGDRDYNYKIIDLLTSHEFSEISEACKDASFSEIQYVLSDNINEDLGDTNNRIVAACALLFIETKMDIIYSIYNKESYKEIVLNKEKIDSISEDSFNTLKIVESIERRLVSSGVISGE